MKRVILFLSIIIPILTNAQTFEVTGTMKDDIGEPFTGATVTNLRTEKTAVVDDIGEFCIEAESGDSLQFSNIGFVTQNIVICDTTRLHIIMQEAEQEYRPFYGTLKKIKIVGNNVITPEELAKDTPNSGLGISNIPNETAIDAEKAKPAEKKNQ
ncbi:hypothetical protein [Dysgonomonas sp. 25]|uniref:hypothetical protein n=1 Tax=Dysgonomonas sp. 25 TaxID=2302933 RepID=UPI0013D2310D|nr:hypothetical protein [Dysgonomonas sp. 25]NDV69794.1 hypothetical protein [Dysgonomonas sp. 25]